MAIFLNYLSKGDENRTLDLQRIFFFFLPNDVFDVQI